VSDARPPTFLGAACAMFLGIARAIWSFISQPYNAQALLVVFAAIGGVWAVVTYAVELPPKRDAIAKDLQPIGVESPVPPTASGPLSLEILINQSTVKLGDYIRVQANGVVLDCPPDRQAVNTVNCNMTLPLGTDYVVINGWHLVLRPIVRSSEGSVRAEIQCQPWSDPTVATCTIASAPAGR